MRFSFPILKTEKTEDGRLLIEGVATSEALDAQGEILDYEGSKRAFEKWRGNLREAHDPTKPVGKALDAAAEDSGDDEDSADASAPASDPASMRLAKAIAGEVQDWIAHGKDGRPVAPGDIMILVRRRRDLAARIVARLQALHVPVAGVDRFALTQPLGVQDLIAAMRFAVQPLDDLNLAALLVSPLIGWTQDELYARTHQRGRAAVWEHLRATEGDVPAATMAALRALLGAADFTTPFRFLETILSGPLDGRRKLYARLGREARDPIEKWWTSRSSAPTTSGPPSKSTRTPRGCASATPSPTCSSSDAYSTT